MEDSGLVGWDLDIANQSRVAPNADGVVWESTGADNLAVMRAPSETGNLGASVDAVNTCTGGGVPEVDVTIV